jgi:hypothetical protein
VRISQVLTADLPSNPAASTRVPSEENASLGCPGTKLDELTTGLEPVSRSSRFRHFA